MILCLQHLSELPTNHNKCRHSARSSAQDGSVLLWCLFSHTRISKPSPAKIPKRAGTGGHHHFKPSKRTSECAGSPYCSLCNSYTGRISVLQLVQFIYSVQGVLVVPVRVRYRCGNGSDQDDARCHCKRGLQKFDQLLRVIITLRYSNAVRYRAYHISSFRYVQRLGCSHPQ
jgi:hypothetical protein